MLPVTLSHHHKPVGSARIARGLRAPDLAGAAPRTWVGALSRGAASDAHESTGKLEPAFQSVESEPAFQTTAARVDDEVSNDDLIDLPLEGREFQVSSRVTSGALLRWQCMGRFEHAQHVRTASRPDGLALAVVSEAPPRMLFCI